MGDARVSERAKVVAETIRFLSWAFSLHIADPDVWATEIETHDYSDSWCCPLCQEVECDPGCPLDILRTGRQTVPITVDTDPTVQRPGHPWNGTDGHNCATCPDGNIWRCDEAAHRLTDPEAAPTAREDPE